MLHNLLRQREEAFPPSAVCLVGGTSAGEPGDCNPGRDVCAVPLVAKGEAKTMHSSGLPEAFIERCVVEGGGDEDKMVDLPAPAARGAAKQPSPGAVLGKEARPECKKEVLLPPSGSSEESVSRVGHAALSSVVGRECHSLGNGVGVGLSAVPDDTDAHAKFEVSPAADNDIAEARESLCGGLYSNNSCAERVSVIAPGRHRGAQCASQASAADDERTTTSGEPSGCPTSVLSPTSLPAFLDPCLVGERAGASPVACLPLGAAAPGERCGVSCAGNSASKPCGVSTTKGDPRPSSPTALVANVGCTWRCEQ